MAGARPLVVRGFELASPELAIGRQADELSLDASQGILIHYYASQAGSIFYTTDIIVELNETDSRFSGSFTANSVNYVGIDLIRTTNNNTEDTVKFIDPVSGEEISRQVPIGNLLDFNVVISSQDFDSIPSILPICKITTDSTNTVTAVEDARITPFRLARGGSYPNIVRGYEWPQGRDENTSGNVFYGGDKGIWSYKDWSDAIMTRLWELGGGKYWYSPTADKNVNLVRTGATFTNGEWYEWDGTNLHWTGLQMVFDNSGTTIFYNTISNQTIDAAGDYGTTATDLIDGDCIYVDIDRTSNATISAIKGITAQLGTPTIPGSRYIVAWRVGTTVYTRGSSFPVGATFFPASETALGIVQLTYAAGNPAIPLVAPQDANGSIHNTATGGNGYGLTGTGNGFGSGVEGYGGASNGAGVYAEGGATNGLGVFGQGTGSGLGVQGTGGATGAGGQFYAGGGNGNGLTARGEGTGAGGSFSCFGDVGPAILADGFSELVEVGSVPASPAAGSARVYLTNNGLGAGVGKRMQLAVKFQDGSIVTIAESDEI